MSARRPGRLRSTVGKEMPCWPPWRSTFRKAHSGQNRKAVFTPGSPCPGKWIQRRFFQKLSRRPRWPTRPVRHFTTIAPEKNTCGFAIVTCLSHRSKKGFAGLGVYCRRSGSRENDSETLLPSFSLQNLLRSLNCLRPFKSGGSLNQHCIVGGCPEPVSGRLPTGATHGEKKHE